MTMSVDGRRCPGSPPPRGEGLGGVVERSPLSKVLLPPVQRLIDAPLTRSFAPHPYPLPTRGRGSACPSQPQS
jgi:hypothetical protein